MIHTFVRNEFEASICKATLVYWEIFLHLALILHSQITSIKYQIFLDCRNRSRETANEISQVWSYLSNFVNNDTLKLSGYASFPMGKFFHLDFDRNNFTLTPKFKAHLYNTRYNTDISLSQTWTKLVENFVLYKGMKVYNGLSNELKCIDDFQKIKQI